MRVTAQGLTLAFIHVDVKVKMSGRCAVYTLYNTQARQRSWVIDDWCISIGMKDPYVLVWKRVNTIIVNAENPERRLNTAGHAMIVPLFYVILIMNRDMRFPTMRHVDMCRLRRACTASF